MSKFQPEQPDPEIPALLQPTTEDGTLTDEEREIQTYQRAPFLFRAWDIEENRRHFRRVGWKHPDPLRFYITNIYNAHTMGGGKVLMLHVEAVIGFGAERVSFGGRFINSRSVQRRLHPPPKKSADGDPVFSDFEIAAWKFSKSFFPDGSWCLPGEWAAAKSEMASLLAKEEALDTAHAEATAAHAGELWQAKLARQNPEAYLGRAIASGIAQALGELGLAKTKPVRS